MAATLQAGAVMGGVVGAAAAVVVAGEEVVMATRAEKPRLHKRQQQCR
jgi:gas vesicle protein